MNIYHTHSSTLLPNEDYMKQKGHHNWKQSERGIWSSTRLAKMTTLNLRI